MKIRIRRLILGLSAAAFLFSSGFAGQGEYLKSATYYSDDWVINFWNSESDHMAEELEQIRRDGFNSIILAVPWREFQPTTSPCTYSDYPWEKLDRVMEAAAAQNLGVMLRVGYTWDYSSSENVLKRYEALLSDEGVRSAWLQYVSRLYQKASAHSNFLGGFLTWEDFWNFVENSGRMGTGEESRKKAQSCGYREYLEEHYSLEEISSLYGTSFGSYDEIYLPPSDSYARKAFYQFYDQFLNQILDQTQQVFPDLSMEVRLDVDPITNHGGTMEGFMHHSTYDCRAASYTSTMFSVNMGFATPYEKLTAGAAINQAPNYFSLLKYYNGGKPIYIDQFLFTDNTPGFESNAQLRDEEKNAYLVGMAPVLKSMTEGYGIWTYRDYGNNQLYNSQFGLDRAGWTFSGSSSVEEKDGSKKALLRSGGRISQTLRGNTIGNGNDTVYVRFQAEGDRSMKVTVQAGNQTKTVDVGEGGVTELAFPGAVAGGLTLTAQGSGRVYLDNIKLYTFVTKGDLYDMDNREDFCIQGIRALNQAL